MTKKSTAKKLRNVTVPGKRPGTRRTRVLQDLLVGNSIRGAAKNAGLSHVTIYRWLKEPAFAAALAAARRDAFFLAKDLLKVLSENSVAVLARMLKSKDEAQRRMAAIAILDRGFKVVDGEDLEARIAEVERICGIRPPLSGATVPEDRKPS